MQARYNEIASIIARHTTSSSPTTFPRLVHSTSLDQHGTSNPSSAFAALTTVRETKHAQNLRRHNAESHHVEESSYSSINEDSYEFSETDTSNHDWRSIEPVLTAANVGPTVLVSLNQPGQIRSSVRLEHRLGPITHYYQPSNVDNHIASCAICNIL